MSASQAVHDSYTGNAGRLEDAQCLMTWSAALLDAAGCEPPCHSHTVASLLQVHIVVDAVSSQRSTDRAAGLHRAAQSGAFLVTSEMALFQLMQVRQIAILTHSLREIEGRTWEVMAW